MNPRPRIKGNLKLLCVGALLLSASPFANAEEGIQGVTAVASKVCDDYVRTRRPDNTFMPELFVFGEGGHFGGAIHDDTIDNLKFIDVARVVAPALASDAYLPGKDPSKTKLLIMVYWGLTIPPGTISGNPAYDNLSISQNAISSAQGLGNAKQAISPTPRFSSFAGLNSGSWQAIRDARDDQISSLSSALTELALFNVSRDQSDFLNATMLGYDSADLIGSEHGRYVRATAFGLKRTELVSEIEKNRYFVVLMAYDFQLMWKQKKHKLLWETRFSISEAHNSFGKALPIMTRYAAKFFGQPSNGLIRTQAPDGKVEVRDPTLIEFISPPRN